MKSRIIGLVRLIVALLPAVNMILVYFGKSPLPFTSDELNVALSGVVEFFAVLWAWWKNNNMTKAAQTSQDILKDLKENKVGGEAE